jgi:hypothetical protein
VYVTEASGLAITTLPVVTLSPAAGNHEYEMPPVAVNILLPPMQKAAAAGDTLISGSGFTITFMESLRLSQPLTVCDTYHVMVSATAVDGMGATDEPVPPAAAYHSKAEPVAVNGVTASWTQYTTGLLTTGGDGTEPTLTVTAEVLLQPCASVPVIV